MTISTVNISLQLALPQGRTANEILEYLNDVFTEIREAERQIVEFEIGEVKVNADPFGNLFAKALGHLPLPYLTGNAPSAPVPGNAPSAPLPFKPMTRW